ncbi:class I mannose-6-phosphate isomerase [Aeromicrobium sp. CTD01-1L150]|uniref:class I mannose-6-phosphate isomerase n=1 Tax=Aeromicrobium sp. CTD01-1L150 TaxID=3341830 RepID=UPI0035BF7FBA
MRPVRLAPNLIDHFYAGGSRIAALRGIETTSARQPEEWIAATVARAGQWPVGLAGTADGHVLRDLVVADPEAWTGSHGDGDTGLLLKLLDAGQRLPVHVHPDRRFAQSHLDCPYGKTEAWLVLEAEPGAAVHLGWTADVDPKELERRRDDQDGAWMLRHMHRVPVARGDGILVPAGTVHAIGAGILVAEVQEPTDFSILLEWSVTTSGREDAHLGLGFETAMPAVCTAALEDTAVEALIRRTDLTARSGDPLPTLPAAANPFFRLHLLAPSGTSRPLEAGFAAVLVLSGSGRLRGAGASLDVAAGDTVAVPAAFGDWAVEGDCAALVARPGTTWPPEGRTS